MKTRNVKMFATGDIMLGDMPACYGFGVASKILENGHDFPWQLVKQKLDDADILIGNLEAVLSEAGRNPLWLPSLYMRGSSNCIPVLNEVGFDVLSLANNHMMQHGAIAYMETVAGLTQCGIQCIGDSTTTALKCIECKGIRFGFLAFSMRPEEYKPGKQLYVLASAEEIVSEVSKYAQTVDHLVVSLHWGDEFVSTPSIQQIELAHKLIDHGASLVAGHHPHVAQGIEPYGNGLIAFSLGNFIFDMPFQRTKESMVLEVVFDKESIVSHSVLPIQINDQHQPEFVDGETAERISRDIRQYSTQSCETHQQYQLQVQSAFEAYRRSVKKNYARSIFQFNPFYLAQLLALIVLRRITNIHI
ncbi:CapA family protein [Aureliella helgolandensis]|uniref:Capsule biosynthesis protein CapA n=1 Tax=Aureliella helgolandensis TaxID=2527968 RepID=A0A518GE01_9BACT|nr:CapA family protein [Aureliella helgolandensis]QDV26823.1 Capsule biosynthesis protein CapA [Aureliella helgolandensis]